MAEERQSQTARGVLIGKQAEQKAGLLHRGLQRGGVGAPLEKQAAGFFAQGQQDAIERRLIERAISGGALMGWRELVETGVKLEVAEVSDGDNHVPRQ